MTYPPISTHPAKLWLSYLVQFVLDSTLFVCLCGVCGVCGACFACFARHTQPLTTTRSHCTLHTHLTYHTLLVHTVHDGHPHTPQTVAGLLTTVLYVWMVRAPQWASQRNGWPGLGRRRADVNSDRARIASHYATVGFVWGGEEGVRVE